MKLIQFGITCDFGKEYYLTFLTTKHHSLLQVSFDVSEYGSWIEFPYLHISMGNGRLFSFLLCFGKLGFSFDFCSRKWNDRLFYAQNNELSEDK